MRRLAASMATIAIVLAAVMLSLGSSGCLDAGDTGGGGQIVARHKLPPGVGGFTRMFTIKRGNGPGEIAGERPGGGGNLSLAASHDGTEILVLDSIHRRANRYDRQGSFLGAIDVAAAVEPWSLLLLADGSLLVHDLVGRAVIHFSPAGDVLTARSIMGGPESPAQSLFGYGPSDEPYLFLSVPSQDAARRDEGKAWWSVPLGTGSGKPGSGSIAVASPGLAYPLGGGVISLSKAGELYVLETPRCKAEFSGGPFTTAGTGTGGGMSVVRAAKDGTVYLEVIYAGPSRDVELAQYILAISRDGEVAGACETPGCLDLCVTGDGLIYGLCHVDSQTLEVVELELEKD